MAAEQRQGLDIEGGGAREVLSGPVCRMPPDIRRGFIRKVYGILCVQLAITGAIASWFHITKDSKWVGQNIELMEMASVGTMALMVSVMCCCQNIARTFPMNYVFLLAITLGESIVVGFVVTIYETQSVLAALAATSVIFACLTAYACLTKRDFTGCGPYLMAMLFSLIGFGFVCMIWRVFFPPLPEAMDLAAAWMGVILFSFYIVFDTQLIVGGAHKVQFSIDDYCFAALNLYLDIIQLFLELLRIFGDRR